MSATARLVFRRYQVAVAEPVLQAIEDGSSFFCMAHMQILHARSWTLRKRRVCLANDHGRPFWCCHASYGA